MHIFSPNRAAYAIITKNTAQPDRLSGHRKQYGAQKIVCVYRVLRQKMHRVILLFPFGSNFEVKMHFARSIIKAKLLSHNI